MHIFAEILKIFYNDLEILLKVMRGNLKYYLDMFFIEGAKFHRNYAYICGDVNDFRQMTLIVVLRVKFEISY